MDHDQDYDPQSLTREHGDAYYAADDARVRASTAVHVRGENAGVEVHAYVDDEGRDVFEVYRTGGWPRLLIRMVDEAVEYDATRASVGDTIRKH